MFFNISHVWLCLLATAISVSGQLSGAQGLRVTARTGTYIGLVNGTTPNVRQFLNVPYALPPVGSRRWLPPVAPVSDPSTVFDATAFPAFCPQYTSGVPSVLDQVLIGYRLPAGLNTTTPASMPPTAAEDCLSLSIWTPTGDVSGLPVIIFMTGGAFIKGGVNIPYQLPHHWVQRTQAHIVVSINYRVGIMGFPNARGLNSQNLGILDQRMAHEWVRDNIEAFGGDPSKITLWGQSAGAESADFHGFAYYNDSIATGVVVSANPDSPGYPSQNLMQSGTAFLPQKSYDFQNSNFTFVASHLGCGRMNATAELDCMRQKPVESIVNFVGRRTDNATEPALSFMPIPDNNIVFSNYTDRYAKGLVARAPAVVGTTSNEASAIVGTNLTAPTQELVEQMTLGSFVCPAHTTAELRDEKGLLTYRYQYAGNFSNLSPLPWLGAYHDADAPLFFGTFDDFSEGSELEARTSEVMQDLLLEFMKDPYNGPEQMGWPESGTGRMLRLGVSEHAVLDIPTQEVDAACDGQGEYASSL